MDKKEVEKAQRYELGFMRLAPLRMIEWH